MRRVVVDLLLPSEAPIVISTEEYPYPEELLAWAYAHARHPTNAWQESLPRAKFVNSGVVVGPAKYLRYFFAQHLLPNAALYADDQHQWARYVVESQGGGLVAHDTSMHLAFSTYKHSRLSNGLMQVWSLGLFFYGEAESKTTTREAFTPSTTGFPTPPAVDTSPSPTPASLQAQLRALIAHPVMAIHANNKESNTIYDTFSRAYQRTSQRYMDDPDRECLLRLLWAWYDGDVGGVEAGIHDLVAWKQTRGPGGISALAEEVLLAYQIYTNQFLTTTTTTL